MNIPSLLKDYTYLEELERAWGDSFYIASPKAFAKNCREFAQAFRRHYPNTNLGYSYKTNYLPAYAATADRLGLYAEVVSGLEMRLALKLKVQPERIIFNGPHKTDDELQSALNLGVRVNIDSVDEFRRIAELRKREPKRLFNLGIRCNFELTDCPDSRFGIAADDPMLTTLVNEIKAWPLTRLRGLHTHICPPGKRPETYAELSKKIIELSQRLFPEKPPEELNLGGGFFSRMPESLKRRWAGKIPEFSDYAEAIGRPFREHFGAQGGPELILEPGLALSADTMFFICRVVARKELGERRVAITSGSIYNIKPTKNSANLPLTVVGRERQPHLSDQIQDITGSTCMEDDLMYEGYNGALAADDYLIFANVGAYTIVLNPPFMRPPPPIISIDENGRAPLRLRGKTTDSDFWRSFNLRVSTDYTD